MDGLTLLVIAEGVAILLLGVLVAGLLRSHADILRKLHDMGVDLDHEHEGPGFRVHSSMPQPSAAVAAAAHDVSGTDAAGGAIGIRVLGAPQPTLLAFLSTGCTTCGEFWQALAAPDATEPVQPARLVIVTKGVEEESPSLVADLAPRDVPVVMSSTAWADYGVPGSPYFVLVDGTGGRVIGEGSATAWDQLRGLVGQALADATIIGRSAGGGRDRADRIDRELAAAGIGPGHPSLYENPEPPDGHQDSESEPASS